MSEDPRAIELGDLVPVRDLLVRLETRLAEEKETNPADDRGVLHLSRVRRELEEALAEAENADLLVSVDDFAKQEGVSRAAIYKRIQRGRLPATSGRGGRLRIRLGSLAS